MLIALAVLLLSSAVALLAWRVGRDPSTRDPDPEGSFRREHGLTPLQMEAVRQASGRRRPPEDPVVRRAYMARLRSSVSEGEQYRRQAHSPLRLVAAFAVAAAVGSVFSMLALARGAETGEAFTTGVSFTGLMFVFIQVVPHLMQVPLRRELRRAQQAEDAGR